MFARSDIYFRLHLLLTIIQITCISIFLCRTSAPIHLTSVLGVLGTQETSCIVIAGLFERDTFDLFLPEFDKPWVIHLRETCYCSTKLYTWRPNTVYKNKSIRRHQRRWIRDRDSIARQSPTETPDNHGRPTVTHGTDSYTASLWAGIPCDVFSISDKTTYCEPKNDFYKNHEHYIIYM
jgi:hypothetical protein